VADSLGTRSGCGRPSVAFPHRAPRGYEAYLAAATCCTDARGKGCAARGAVSAAIAAELELCPCLRGPRHVYQLWVSTPILDRLLRGRGQAVAMARPGDRARCGLAEAYAAVVGMTRAWAPPGRSPPNSCGAELRPNSPDVHQWYAGSCRAKGH